MTARKPRRTPAEGFMLAALLAAFVAAFVGAAIHQQRASEILAGIEEWK